MRALALLFVGMAALGCTHKRWLCESEWPLDAPREDAAFEIRKPESPAHIDAAPRAMTMTVQPRPLDEDAWGESVFERLPPRALPALSAEPALGGDVLVCAFTAGPSPGIDGIDGLDGRTAISISTPDLLVWADFAGAEINKGPRSSSSTGIFAFKVALRQDDPISITFGDHDTFSANDYIGRIEGKYPGKVPFTIRGQGGSATCKAASPDFLEEEAGRRRRELDRLLTDYEAHQPTVPEPVALDLIKRIEIALGAIEYLSGSAEPETKEATRRVEEGTRKQWVRYIELLREAHAGLPPPGTWVRTGNLAEARSGGLRCEPGERSASGCQPVLELRLLRDTLDLECNSTGNPVSGLGEIGIVRADGRSSGVLPSGYRVNGRWLQKRFELWQLKKGDVLFIPLFAGGDFTSRTHVGWNVPLLVVGDTLLRVY